MSNEPVSMDEKKSKVQKPEKMNPPKQHAEGPSPEASMADLQKIIGNRAVQRLIAQRAGDDSYELDDKTAGNIDQERGGGQPLDSQVQKKMSSSMGHDFSDVKVHTSEKSDTLNQQLGAEAFTTGSDVFFRQGNYNPGSADGQKLIAHELTHVVQQSTGQVSGGGSGVTVGAPHDAYEQEADQVAQTAVQRDHAEDDKDEAVQTKALQRQEMPVEDKDEDVQTKAIQREAMPVEDKDEDVQTKAVQREAMPVEDKDEDVQTKAVQRQESDKKDEI